MKRTLSRIIGAVIVAACFLAGALQPAFAGTPSGTGTDLAPTVQTGTFASTTTSTAIQLYGSFNLTLYGSFVASVTLQRSFDGGTNWINASLDTAGTYATYTTAITVVANEPEPGVLYRLNCTYTSGTVNYRISGGPRLT